MYIKKEEEKFVVFETRNHDRISKEDTDADGYIQSLNKRLAIAEEKAKRYDELYDILTKTGKESFDYRIGYGDKEWLSTQSDKIKQIFYRV